MKNQKGPCWQIGLSLLVVLLFGLTRPSFAFTPGKTYDKSNYQEIEDILAPSVLLSVKSGEFCLKTSKLDFDVAIKADYKKLSESNEGKYD